MERLSFFISMLLPAAMTAVVLILQKRRLGKLSYWTRQLIIGLMFGAVAALSTFMAIKGVISINVRDVSPMAAGLLFGGPAGIISGVIGGAVRLMNSVIWDVGGYSGIASATCTVLAGLMGAFMRRVAGREKRYVMIYGVTMPVILKILHMMLIFVLRIESFQEAFIVVRHQMLSMIFVNLISMVLTLNVYLFTERRLSGRKRKNSGKKEQRSISDIIHLSILFCLVVAFVLTNLLANMMQHHIAVADMQRLLKLNLEDVPREVNNSCSVIMVQRASWIANAIDELGHETASGRQAGLDGIADAFMLHKMYVTDAEGIITYSKDGDHLGFDTGEDSMEGLRRILGGEKVIRDDLGLVYFQDPGQVRYIGYPLSDGGTMIVGARQERLVEMVQHRISAIAISRHVGMDGFIMIADAGGRIVSSGAEYGSAATLEEAGICMEDHDGNIIHTTPIYGISCYLVHQRFDTIMGEYIAVVALPVSEAHFSQELAALLMICIESVVFIVMFALLYVQMKRLVVDNIQKANKTLGEIASGNLDVVMDVRNNLEFSKLSDDINATVDALKELIHKEAARIDQDLANARAIQLAAMPSSFPAFPGRQEFEIWASMHTAKEVGGDFYDFYLLDDDHIAFMIADVSGKGIPAAMFMMNSKTLIKSMAEDSEDVAAAFTSANSVLCKNAGEKMFVTAWMGVMDLRTGLVQYVNAGHNPPLVRRGGGEFEFLRTRPNLVLAGIPEIKYRLHELQLEPGDELFLYTDGVTEALDKNRKMYGEARLLELFRSGRLTGMSQSEALAALREDILKFTAGAEQADDITMLTLRFVSKSE